MLVTAIRRKERRDRQEKRVRETEDWIGKGEKKERIRLMSRGDDRQHCSMPANVSVSASVGLEGVCLLVCHLLSFPLEQVLLF